MKITKEELIDALDNLFDPYPAFTSPEQKEKWLIEQGIYKDELFDNDLYEDMHDDINNCGRNPLACFMEHAKEIYLLKVHDLTEYDGLIDYLIESINDHE